MNRVIVEVNLDTDCTEGQWYSAVHYIDVPDICLDDLLNLLNECVPFERRSWVPS